MQVYIVDAFADALFCGNTAGVVLLEDGQDFPSDILMVQAAAELRYSETAFVKRLGDNRYHTRYFTPTGEVALCGHATIAAFHVLSKQTDAYGMWLNQTGAGALQIQLLDGLIYMEMAAPVYQFTIDSCDALAALHHALRLVYDPCNQPLSFADWPVECISTGLPDILFPVVNEEALASISPDFEALSALSKQYDVVGVHAFAVNSTDSHIHCRNFAPRYGIDEEAATGTANGALTWYLHRRGKLLDGATAATTFIQGEAMGRASAVYSLLDTGNGRQRIQIGGNAVIWICGTLHF